MTENGIETEQGAPISAGRGLLALSPVVVFLLLYVAMSLILDDFYKMPI